MLDFIRIACAVPAVKVADVKKNAQDICAYMEKADAQNVDVVLFPELALTGYTCADLFFQDTLWKAVKAGVKEIADWSGKYPNLTAVVGLPVRIGTKLYNCAAVFSRGEVVGIVPKTNLTASEKRWFASGADVHQLFLDPEDVGLVSSEDYWAVPVEPKMLFTAGCETEFAIEICEDLMVPQPCSSELASFI